jgi:hypothetical protein
LGNSQCSGRKSRKEGRGDIGFDILINSLESEDVGLRNRVALALRKKKDNGAVDPLLKAILSPENRDYNGTMVYALQTLNCQYKLVELFQILFYESYESKMMAYMILEEQIFEFSQADLFEIQKMWQDCLQQPKKINGFEEGETRLMMEDM